MLKDANFRYRSVNQAFCSVLGKRAEEIIGKSDEELFSPEDAVLCVVQDAEVLKTRQHLEKDRVIAGSKGRVWFRVKKTPVFDASGKVTGVLCMARDISRIKKAELEFDRLFNLTPDMVCIASSNGHFTKINQAWQNARLFRTGAAFHAISQFDSSRRYQDHPG